MLGSATGTPTISTRTTYASIPRTAPEYPIATRKEKSRSHAQSSTKRPQMPKNQRSGRFHILSTYPHFRSALVWIGARKAAANSGQRGRTFDGRNELHRGGTIE